jgi:HK97 gp10 family phage protein
MPTKVQGLDLLARNLRGLTDDMRQRGLRSATAAAAVLVRDEARTRAPVETGKLREALYVVRDRAQESDESAVYHVGVRAGKKAQRIGKKKKNLDAFYWKFVEFGHFTRAPGAKRSDSKVKRTLRRALHKVRFIAARPFLRPALEHSRDRVVAKIAQVLAARIRRFTAQLAKGKQ